MKSQALFYILRKYKNIQSQKYVHKAVMMKLAVLLSSQTVRKAKPLRGAQPNVP